MQLTRFDRWVREKFIYRTHIYIMRMPEAALPAGVLVEELEVSPTKRYRYRLIANAESDAKSVIDTLKQANQMFATRIEEANPWYKKIIAPEGKSFFFRLVWLGLAGCMVFSLITATIIVLSNEELRGQIVDAFILLKDG